MESAAELPAVGDASPAPTQKSKLPVLLVITAGLLVGATVGAFIAGPMIARKFAPPPAEHAGGKVETGKEGKDVKDAAKTLRVVDNLVLNPAGTDGQRYLMLTATFEVKDAAADEMLKGRDAEVRDVLLGKLGVKTVEELTDMSKREELKAEVLKLLAPMFPPGTIRKVYFPQFVIQ